MTNEEKQELIQACRDNIKYAADYPAVEVRMARVALAALTAQPVKLPEVRIFCNSNKSHRKVIYAVTDAIRAAGYEVQE